MAKKEQYSSKDWCNLIAWLINCDNKLFQFNDKIYTADNCWNCNSHGELFGILGAIHDIQKIMNTKKPEFKIWEKILNREIIEPDYKNASGLGMLCITQMWRCSEEFEDFVDAILGDKKS